MFYLELRLATKSIKIDKLLRLQWINNEYMTLRRLPLRLLLFETRDRECKNPRDKVYALLGLMFEASNVLIQPDYMLAIEQVYANTARFITAADSSLDFICEHEPQDLLPGLPSWAPDLRTFGTTSAIPLVDPSGRKNIFHASLLDSPSTIAEALTLPRDWQVLRPRGICIGTVSHLSFVSPVGASSKYIEKQWNSSLRQHLPTDEDQLAALNTISALVSLFDYSMDSPSHPLFWSYLGIAHLLRTFSSGISSSSDITRSFQCKYLTTLICGRTDITTRCDSHTAVELMNQVHREQ